MHSKNLRFARIAHAIFFLRCHLYISVYSWKTKTYIQFVWFIRFIKFSSLKSFSSHLQSPSAHSSKRCINALVFDILTPCRAPGGWGGSWKSKRKSRKQKWKLNKTFDTEKTIKNKSENRTKQMQRKQKTQIHKALWAAKLESQLCLSTWLNTLIHLAYLVWSCAYLRLPDIETKCIWVFLKHFVTNLQTTEGQP